MKKGIHGLQQRALVYFSLGIALFTPAGWLLQDWYSGNLTETTYIFKVFLSIIHVTVGFLSIIKSIGINDQIDKELKNELV